jgi:hypothetical protein
LFGREHVINFIWEQLAGNSVLLVAPRRFGKTGVMNHILRRPREGYLPVYLEVEELEDPEGFAAALLTALLEHDSLRALIGQVKSVPKRIADFFSSRVGKIKTEVLKDSWQAIARTLILEMEKADEALLFLIDEFPQFVENVARKHGVPAARGFLQWFRSIRMRQKDVLRRYRFVLGGSTSIDMTLRRLEVPDKLNDFFRVPIEPLGPEAARALLDALAAAHGIRLTPHARDAVFDLVAPPVPYFLQLLVAQVRMEERLKGTELTEDDVRDIYRRRILGPTCRAYFDYYRQRLHRYGEPAERAAFAILQEVAHAPSGRVSATVLYDAYRRARKRGASPLEFDLIMADLETDWYVLLDTKTNEYGFLLTVMRDWWLRFHRLPRRAGK